MNRGLIRQTEKTNQAIFANTLQAIIFQDCKSGQNATQK